jgi:hypothetical protein
MQMINIERESETREKENLHVRERGETGDGVATVTVGLVAVAARLVGEGSNAMVFRLNSAATRSFSLLSTMFFLLYFLFSCLFCVYGLLMVVCGVLTYGGDD